jgi:hypothetical protein
LFVKNGKLVFTYNFLGIPPEQRLVCDAPKSGTHIVGVDFAKQAESDSASKLPTPRLINLMTDPQEREPFSLPHLHTWTAYHLNRIIGDFEDSVHREPPIPMGAPLDHVPRTS